ncbi:hypothetical protein NC652_031844 [Populus alba x Populus x berolinensis]|nr:hypothetical protein NC652_031844 [Populus alba x Populus x berolinensis]
MVGPRSWIAGLFTRSPYKRNDKVLDFCLTPHLEQRLQKLQERMRTPFDETRPDHQGGQRATWEYPFAVAGINVSFMLIQMLDLRSEKPRCLPGVTFVKLLGGGFTSNKDTIGEGTIFGRCSSNKRFTSIQPFVSIAIYSEVLLKCPKVLARSSRTFRRTQRFRYKFMCRTAEL